MLDRVEQDEMCDSREGGSGTSQEKLEEWNSSERALARSLSLQHRA